MADGGMRGESLEQGEPPGREHQQPADPHGRQPNPTLNGNRPGEDIAGNFGGWFGHGVDYGTLSRKCNQHACCDHEALTWGEDAEEKEEQ